MKIKHDEGFCTCCGNFSEYNDGDEEHSFVTKDLNNYNKYKDIYVYQCPNCGFISTDITGVEGVMFGEVRHSLEFKDAINYKYLKGLDTELYNNHSQEVPANLYEAYSFICLAAKDYEKFLRSINKTIELKLVMAKKYRRSQDELGGEEDNDDLYDDLDKLIKESINSNEKQIDYYFTQLETKNIFVKLLYIENLTRINKKQEAKQLFDNLIKNNSFKQDLKQYFYNLFK